MAAMMASYIDRDDAFVAECLRLCDEYNAKDKEKTRAKQSSGIKLGAAGNPPVYWTAEDKDLPLNENDPARRICANLPDGTPDYATRVDTYMEVKSDFNAWSDAQPQPTLSDEWPELKPNSKENDTLSPGCQGISKNTRSTNASHLDHNGSTNERIYGREESRIPALCEADELWLKTEEGKAWQTKSDAKWGPPEERRRKLEENYADIVAGNEKRKADIAADPKKQAYQAWLDTFFHDPREKYVEARDKYGAELLDPHWTILMPAYIAKRKSEEPENLARRAQFAKLAGISVSTEGKEKSKTTKSKGKK